MVADEVRRFELSHEEQLHNHVYIKAIQLLDQRGIRRRLKTIKPFELVGVKRRIVRVCSAPRQNNLGTLMGNLIIKL